MNSSYFVFIYLIVLAVGAAIFVAWRDRRDSRSEECEEADSPR